MRVRIQSYNGKSRSSKELANFLGVKRLKVHKSKFKPKKSDIIINWGKPKNVLPLVTYLNPIKNIGNATNKLLCLRILSESGVPVPKYSTNLHDLEENVEYFARTTLHGHSGKGIIVGTKQQFNTMDIEAPLYTQYIKKIKEYRVIVVNNKIIDVKLKQKKREWEGERDGYIWNVANGYCFTRNNSSYHPNLSTIGLKAVKALDLCYCAVDIIEDREHNLYVLECNTAFGLEGTTIELVGKEIQNVIESRR